jgi:tripartite-type tricarboxylate transporter receptor subunit TctC
MKSLSMRCLVAGAGFLVVLTASAAAEEWPINPIRIVVGAGPGGGTDVVTRIISQPLSEILHQPVVVENKTGAGSIVAGSSVARAAKDGYTAYMMNNAHSVSAAIYKSLPFDPVSDFAMVSLTATAGLALVTSPKLGVSDVKGLIAAAKSAPGTINFASVGIGSTQYFSGELFRQLARVDIVHIPYRTTPEVITALRQNEVQITFELVQPVLGQIRAGDLRALAVTSARRYPILPDVPTIADSGLEDYQVTSWYGLAFPAGTPQPIVDKMNRALHQVLGREAVRKQIMDVGATARTSTAEEMRAHIEAEIANWRRVREKAGIVLQ